MRKTVALTGGVQEVKFAVKHQYFHVHSLGGEVLASLTPEVERGKDDVLIVSSGGAGYIQNDMASDTVYLAGSGEVQVTATGNAFPPSFSSGSKGGGEITTEGGTITAVTVDYPIVSLNLYGKSVQDGTPTPKNPVDIVSIGDDGAVEVAACGKNLYDISTATRQLVSEDGSVVNDPVYLLSDYISCSDYDKITISGVVGTGAVWYRLAKYDTDKNFIVRVAEKNVQTGAYTFDVSDCTYIRLCYEDEPVNDAVVKNVQVEYGATATTYEPYTSNTATITSGLPLCSVGNVRDELIYNADGTGKIIKRCNSITIDTETIVERTEYPNGSGIYRFNMGYAQNPNFYPSANDKGICNMLAWSSAPLGNNSVDNCICVYEKGGAYARYDACQTIEEFKKLGITVVYQLATPQEINLSADEITALMKLQTFNGITNIYNDEDAEMKVKVTTNPILSEYVKPVIDGITARFEARIAALEAAVTNT